jgi:glycosyltransferase involved in cell wall biosynthesis
MAALVQRLSAAPVVVTAHGADVFGLNGTLLKAIKRYTLKNANMVTVVSKALINALDEIMPLDTQSQVIPMGVDSKIFSPEKRNDLIRKKYAINGHFLLYVGRLTEKKGVRYLIDAMPRLLQKAPDAKLLIIGTGELEEELKELVISLGLRAQIQFAGSVLNKDLPEYYATADIFIGPSITAKSGDTEGFGLTFVEAAMSGCLVIASDVGGIRDIIQDNETGFLVDPLNTHLLTEKIRYTLKHEDQLNQMREKSRSRCVRKYDWKVIAARYKELFKQIISL